MKTTPTFYSGLFFTIDEIQTHVMVKLKRTDGEIIHIEDLIGEPDPNELAELYLGLTRLGALVPHGEVPTLCEAFKQFSESEDNIITQIELEKAIATDWPEYAIDIDDIPTR